VRSALLEEPRRIESTEADQNPMGSLHINAMRLADIFSDDSNFRNIVMDSIVRKLGHSSSSLGCSHCTIQELPVNLRLFGCFRQAPDLATVLAAAPATFLSRWCEGDIAVNLAKDEIDATLIYDPFQAAGAALLKGSSAPVSPGPGSSVHALEDMETGCVLSTENTSPDHYARERSALLVKLFANLYCFNPEVCSGILRPAGFKFLAEVNGKSLQRMFCLLIVSSLSRWMYEKMALFDFLKKCFAVIKT
jgi:hypothetical protein